MEPELVPRPLSVPCGIKEVCHQYWPEQGIESYGEFTIESGGQEVHDGYTTRTLYLAAAKVGVATVDVLALCGWVLCGCVGEFGILSGYGMEQWTRSDVTYHD